MRWPLAVPAALALVCGLTACPRRVPLIPPIPPTPFPLPSPAPTPPPTPPPPYVPNKRLETGRIFNGLQYRVTLETEVGTTATADRTDPASYVADLRIKVRVPKPHQDLAAITRLNDQLPVLLPGLPRPRRLRESLPLLRRPLPEKSRQPPREPQSPRQPHLPAQLLRHRDHPRVRGPQDQAPRPPSPGRHGRRRRRLRQRPRP